MQLLFLLILLSWVSMGAAVAGCRSDRDKDHRPRENCTAAGFSDIPVGLEPTTKVLLFPSNLFSSLSWSSFQLFTEIYEIDITGNKVPEVTPTANPILPTLSVLRLGSNRLTSLPDGSFSACPGLTELYLENNAINSLSDRTFSGLTKLEILDLSSNHIKVLPQSMLHPLPAIETLYLENNKISVMPDEWFSQKEEVPYLYLSANPWACSCSLGYLRRYLDDYELNVYVRDGPDIKSDVESVVCDSPQQYKGTSVTNLEESDLCSKSGPDGDFYQPTAPYSFYIATSAPVPATTTYPPPDSTTFVDLYTMHRVITWSWYEVITRLIERSDYSHKEITTQTLLGFHDLTTHSTTSTTRHSTTTKTIPAETTSSIALTTTPPTTTMNIVTTATTEATTAYEAVTTTKSSPEEKQKREKLISSMPAGLFCIWLFAGCLLLCMASAACILATLARMVIWYRRVYKPLCVRLERRRGGSEGLMLLTYNRAEGKEVGGEGVMALYRSVLLVHKEAGEGVHREDEGEGGEGDKKQGQLVILKPTGGGATREEEGERSGREERAVYKKTLYRLLSKEEEIEGWRDVVEECRLSEEDGGQKGGGQYQGIERERSRVGEGVSKKRYSVILREERQDVKGGKEELDWVVGGWEVKRGGEETEEEPRSSWGEWLAHYLPSMPWGVTAPSEAEAAL